MDIYILDESDKFLKLTVISGSPHNGLHWEAKVYEKNPSGKWVFRERAVFDSSIRNGISFLLKNTKRIIARFYIPPKI